ncbi:peptidase M14, carboxypeptidase A [Chondromyces apiculatus DSM 436]|uniref:Peptidase M14, carboxypeptidase A n=2 Tax=Chondromyces apiculatus TaxID=51 RepID=A0A017T2G0_9BACT|nr:peptidase M14, carboxypeptidase A [Chondromyces apiculatus DSM 436]
MAASMVSERGTSPAPDAPASAVATSAALSLEALSLGFRCRYLSYDDLTRQVHAWADAFPHLVRVSSIGTTTEGRALWLLTIGPEPDRLRPAAWVDGNMHASEFSGSSVALAIAEDAIRAHLDPASPLHDLPPHLADIVREDILLYVLPRVSPDGAEQVLQTDVYVRSLPRDGRLGRSEPYWRHADVDGDGKAYLMRREDPAGDFVASPEIPGLMLPRRIEDPGPYYTLYPEGFIEHWDGFTVPAPSYLSDNETDLNRNFPYGWAPEPRQQGAGAFATSEPESRAITEFATRSPHIFAWLNLHTFGGVYIRPSGDRVDKKMNPQDLELYHLLGEWAERFTGYPMVSMFEEFTYEPDTPLAGDLASFAYTQRGAVSMVCELWDFWKQAGVEVLRPFVWNYQRRTREDVIRIGRWDQEHNQGRLLRPWRAFEHPQLGPVEVGGYDPYFSIVNPPPERLPELCAAQARFFLRLSALGPRLRLASIELSSIGEGLTRVEATVENVGFLPTYVLSSSRALPWNEPVRAGIALDEGMELLAGDTEQEVGHLGGWGGYQKSSVPFMARTSGEAPRRRVSWVVRGRGAVVLRARSVRMGQVEARVDVG